MLETELEAFYYLVSYLVIPSYTQLLLVESSNLF